MRLFLITLFCVLFFCFFAACGYANTVLTEPQVIDDFAYIVYLPSGIDMNGRYPLVIALSPTADAESMIETWVSVSEKFKWIIFASKKYKNGVDIGPVLEQMMSTILNLYSKLPIDPSRVVASGVSGGGMGAHALAFLYPKPILAVIVNTGVINDYFLSRKHIYPRDKVAVFLASPADFRYEQMKKDRKLLEDLGWKTKWIEFKGGHVTAPPSAYQEAAQWLSNQ